MIGIGRMQATRLGPARRTLMILILAVACLAAWWLDGGGGATTPPARPVVHTVVVRTVRPVVRVTHVVTVTRETIYTVRVTK